MPWKNLITTRYKAQTHKNVKKNNVRDRYIQISMKGVCNVPKKGDQVEYKNKRGITFLNLAYKIYSNLLYSCFLLLVQRQIRTYDCGFLPEKWTINQIFNHKKILEKTIEYGIRTYDFLLILKLHMTAQAETSCTKL